MTGEGYIGSFSHNYKILLLIWVVSKQVLTLYTFLLTEINFDFLKCGA